MDSKAKILGIIRLKGPVTPMQIAREIKVESFMASALLSELVSEKMLRISSLKVGSSPLYYLPCHEERLEQFMGNLNEKDRRTAMLLKQRGILRDSAQDPLTRVSLRTIKDFAIPLEVSLEGKTEMFWKWHMLPPGETERLVRDHLGMLEVKKPEPVKQEKVEKEEILLKPEPAEKPKKRVQRRLAREKIEKDAFAMKVQEFFAKNSIEVIQQEMIRKNEHNFVIKLSSSVGELTYYCIAKNKQKISEGDLAAAYVKGESKKLPVLFVTTGDLTKQAKEMCAKEFKNIAIKKI